MKSLSVEMTVAVCPEAKVSSLKMFRSMGAYCLRRDIFIVGWYEDFNVHGPFSPSTVRLNLYSEIDIHLIENYQEHWTKRVREYIKDVFTL